MLPFNDKVNEAKLCNVTKAQSSRTRSKWVNYTEERDRKREGREREREGESE